MQKQMALFSLRPIPMCHLRRPRMRMAIRSRAVLPSASWGTISLAEALRNVARESKQIEAELPGCSILGVLSQDAKVYKQPALGMLTTLQDDQDSSLSVKLLINNFTIGSTTDADAQVWFPRGARVRIVEPRVLVAGAVGFAIMVDNPASLEIIDMGSPGNSSSPDAKAYWTAGNAAFVRGEYLRAAHFFRRSIELGVPAALQAYSRSSEAWLKLGVHEKAFADAEKALIQNPSHFRSLFVKGQALLAMQEYHKAMECFLQAEAAASGSEDKARVAAVRQRCSILRDQSVSGVYDLSKFLLSGRAPETAPECSDFVGPVRLGVSEGKGRGLFATRDLRAGELLLVSNSIARSLKGGPEFHAKIGRACLTDRRALAKLIAFFDQQEMFSMDLFLPNSGWFFNNAEIHAVPNSSYRCVFQELGKRNGLCPLATMINHSCIPNVSRQAVGGALFVRASRDIHRDEELITCYFDPFQPLLNRRKQAAERNFEFVCGCGRCKLEEEIGSEKPGLAERYINALLNRKDASAAVGDLIRLSQELDSIAGEEIKNKQWLICSFPYAYWAAAFVSGKTKADKEARLEKAVTAFHETAPGDSFTLRKMVELCSPGGAAFKGGIPEYRNDRVRELLRREAVCCFGDQSDEVIEAVIRNPGAGAAAGDLSF